jgi:hypothetical protein
VFVSGEASVTFTPAFLNNSSVGRTSFWRRKEKKNINEVNIHYIDPESPEEHK